MGLFASLFVLVCRGRATVCGGTARDFPLFGSFELSGAIISGLASFDVMAAESYSFFEALSRCLSPLPPNTDQTHDASFSLAVSCDSIPGYSGESGGIQIPAVSDNTMQGLSGDSGRTQIPAGYGSGL